MAQKLTTYQKARLQVVAYRVIQGIVSEVLSGYKLNTSQWVILGYLRDNSEGLRVTAIADILRVETPLITSLTQSLLSRGLISSEADETDKRAKRLKLTDDGAALVQTIEPILSERLDTFDAGLTPADILAYFSALDTFIAAAQQQTMRRKS